MDSISPQTTGWDAPEQLLTERLETLAQASRQQPFDAIVVGGGTAGVTAGLALAGRGERVALLEAGPIALLTHAGSSDLRFQGRSTSDIRRPYEYAPVHAQTGEPFGMLVGALGGRAQFWQGPCPRMQPHEIAAWPVDLDELDPYYCWIEERFRVTSSYGDTRLLRAIATALGPTGWPVVPLPMAVDTRPVADGWLSGTIGNAMSMLLRAGTLTGTARNPCIALGAFVARVLLDASGAARGVAALDRRSAEDPATQATHEVFAHRVLLAAGAFESVRLAQVSQVPDRSSRLGTAIVDHQFAALDAKMVLDGYEPQPFEPALAHIPSTPERPWQVEVHAPPVREMFLAREDARPTGSRPYAAHVRAFAPLRANAANHVHPLDEDRPGAYRVHLAYSEEDEAGLEALQEGLRMAARLLGDENAEPEARPPGYSYHEAGGLGMGVSADASVTDPAGRFWACPNIVACDASAWPTTGATNPHITIAAVSRRNALAPA